MLQWKISCDASLLRFRLLFVQKLPSKYAPEKPVVNALFGKQLRVNGDCDVTETQLKWTSWSSSLSETAKIAKDYAANAAQQQIL